MKDLHTHTHTHFLYLHDLFHTEKQTESRDTQWPWAGRGLINPVWTHPTSPTSCRSCFKQCRGLGV